MEYNDDDRAPPRPPPQQQIYRLVCEIVIQKRLKHTHYTASQHSRQKRSEYFTLTARSAKWELNPFY